MVQRGVEPTAAMPLKRASAVIEAMGVSVSINWLVQSGCMADVCSAGPAASAEPLVCHRGTVNALCEINIESAITLKVLLNAGRCNINCNRSNPDFPAVEMLHLLQCSHMRDIRAEGRGL